MNEKGKLVLAGFSQGCGMSLHSYYELPHVIDYVIGAAGYLFPFSKYSAEKTKGNIKIIYGLNDDLRPWEYTKVTYEKKFEEGKDIILLH